MSDKLLNFAGSPYVIYAILAIAVMWIIAFGFFERNSIVSNLKGADGQWQFIEIAMLIWIILFPTMIVCDLLGAHPSDKAWLFMEIIFTSSVTGKTTQKVMESKYRSKDKDK